MLGAFFITAFTNITNDIFDVEEDRINHPNRPLPSGRVAEWEAWAFAVFALFFALLFSFKHSYWTLAVGSLAMYISLLYNVYLKSLPVVGNLSVAFVVSLAFLYGSGGYHLERVLPAALLGAYLHFTREIVKSLQDKEGDHPFRRTVAHVIPERYLRRLVFSLLILLPPLTPIPVMLGYSTLYALSVLPLVGLPALPAAYFVLRGRYSLSSGLLKLITLLALIPLWLA